MRLGSFKKIIVSVVAVVLLCGGIFITYIFLTLGEWHDANMNFTGTMKVVENEFQTYFHDKDDYPAYTLEELHNKGILSDFSYENLVDYLVSYTPFFSETPEDSVVIEAEEGSLLGVEIQFKKGELTSDPNKS